MGKTEGGAGLTPKRRKAEKGVAKENPPTNDDTMADRRHRRVLEGREGLRREQVRKSRSKKRQRAPPPRDNNGPASTETEKRRKWDSAKSLANIGEYRKAVSALRSNGTAKITESVLEQLKRKHPRRTRPITRPRPPCVEAEDANPNDVDDWDMLLPFPPEEDDYGHNPSHASGANPHRPSNDHQGVSPSTIMDIEPGICITDPGRSAHTERGMENIPDEKDQNSSWKFVVFRQREQLRTRT